MPEDTGCSHDGAAALGDPGIYMIKGVGEVRAGAVERSIVMPEVFVDEALGSCNASTMGQRRLVTVVSTRSRVSVTFSSDGWGVLVLPGKRQLE